MKKDLAAGDRLVLALDAGSPRVSVALGRGTAVLASRAVPQERSATQLLALVAEVLAAAGARPADLGGVVALAGPGSFTGLRVALATALGFHQALGLPAQAVPTLAALAAAALAATPEPPPGFAAGTDGAAGRLVVAAVDALRGEWSAQAFAAGLVPEPRTAIELLPGAGLVHRLLRTPLGGQRGDRGAGSDGSGGAWGAPRSPVTLIAFGVAAIGGGTEGDGTTANRAAPPDADAASHFQVHRIDAWDAPPLAEAALRLAAAIPIERWQAASLADPVYSRPPAATLPKPRRAAAATPPGADR